MRAGWIVTLLFAVLFLVLIHATSMDSSDALSDEIQLMRRVYHPNTGNKARDQCLKECHKRFGRTNRQLCKERC